MKDEIFNPSSISPNHTFSHSLIHSFTHSLIHLYFSKSPFESQHLLHRLYFDCDFRPITTLKYSLKLSCVWVFICNGCKRVYELLFNIYFSAIILLFSTIECVGANDVDVGASGERRRH